MTAPAREPERDLTRDQFYGWLARMYRRHLDEQEQPEEPACDDSTASE
jgi:hypothetical protein